MMNKAFSFKEMDTEGMQTLEAVSAAPAFNEWMYRVTSARLKGKILEIGSGIGNISAFYLREHRRIVLSDIRENYCDYLRSTFADQPTLEGVLQIDLTHPAFDEAYASLLGSFDGVFALNVVEHIKDDSLAIANCHKLLCPGGRLVILVPAYPFLYNGFDRALEHYRRYTKTSLRSLFTQNGFTLSRAHYFNLAGIAGWFVSGNLLGNTILPTGQMKLYNALVPLFKLIDRLVFRSVGLSVVVEGIKKPS